MSGYTWNISAGGTITGGAGTNTITVTWNTAGAQWVSVNYTDGNGCTAATATVKNVTVNSLPVPTITGLAVVCEGTAGVTYSTEASMAGYTWNISAGGTITGGGGTNTITVTWNTAGAQWVSVNYTDGNGCTAATATVKNVTINSLPVPTITGLAVVCEGTAGVTYFTEPLMAGYTWNISAGGTITGGSGTSTITVTWNTAGAQWVSVNYTDGNGCTAATATVKNVTVNPLPVPTITGLAVVCEGTAGVTYSTEALMAGYTWNISAGGIITGGTLTNAITVSWLTAGPQWVSVSYTDGNGCIAASPSVYNVTVNPLPVPTISGLNPVCIGATGVTYSTEPLMTGYTWNISAGGTITGGSRTNTITVAWNLTGAQWVSVSYTDGNGCTAASATVKNITVNPLPVPTITGTTPVCQGASGVTYTTEPLMTGYTWNISAGGTITGGGSTNTITVTWNTAGAQWVSVNYTDANGCTALLPVQYSVTVIGPPAAAGVISGPTEVCVNSTGVVYSIAPVMGALSYSWTVPPFVTITSGSGSNSITVSFSGTPGTGNFSVYGVNVCANGNPSPNLSVTSNTQLTGQDIVANLIVGPSQEECYDAGSILVAGGGTYVTVQNQGQLLLEASQYIRLYPGTKVYPGGYLHAWIATMCIPCSSLKPSETILVYEGEDLFRIYPNPTTGEFTVEMSGASDCSRTIVRIHSLMGKEIFRQEITGLSKAKFSLRDKPVGIYLVNVLCDDKSKTVKIIKQ
jgi:hypothetical protein